MNDANALEFLHALGTALVASELHNADILRSIDPNSLDWRTSEIKADLLNVAINAICGNPEETATAISGAIAFARETLSINID